MKFIDQQALETSKYEAPKLNSSQRDTSPINGKSSTLLNGGTQAALSFSPTTPSKLVTIVSTSN